MHKRNAGQFNCFSPPIMLVTLLIEFSLAVYTVWRYKLDVTGRLVLAMLVSLATFQLAEYQVCTSYGFNAEQWSRLGYVAITLLPALGLHLLYVLMRKSERKLVLTAYFTMAAFVGYFLTYSAAFVGYKCTGNYVIFQIGVGPAVAYGLYYYAWLGTALLLGLRWTKAKAKVGKKQRLSIQATYGLLIGYLVFLVPTAVANSVKPETRRGIPSIMCGFAVLFALLLVLYMLPRVGQRRSNHGRTEV